VRRRAARPGLFSHEPVAGLAEGFVIPADRENEFDGGAPLEDHAFSRSHAIWSSMWDLSAGAKASNLRLRERNLLGPRRDGVQSR